MIPVIVILTLSLDQLTKFAAIRNLSQGQTLPVVKGIFHFTLVSNRGAAFGMLKGQTPFFIFSALLAIALIYQGLKGTKSQGQALYRISLGLILSGAVGNLIDRLRFGYVIDFLDFRVWPVFNVADSAITIGAILLGYCICFQKSAK